MTTLTATQRNISMDVYESADEQFCNEALAREYGGGPRFGLGNLAFLLGMGLVMLVPVAVVGLAVSMILFCSPAGCGI